MFRKLIAATSALAVVLFAGAVSAFDDPIVIHITGPGATAKYILEGDTVQKDVTVQVGQTVRWANDRATTKTHTASSSKLAAQKRVFDTLNIPVGGHADVVMDRAKFAAAGGTAGGSVDLEYICTVHGGNNMKSKIILNDSASPTTPPNGDERRKDTARDPVVVSRILSVEYHEQEINPPNLVVKAIGQVPTTGYRDPKLTRVVYITPPDDGVQDYFLTATPPSGGVATVLSRVEASDEWQGYLREAPWIKGIRVHGVGKGVVEKKFGESYRKAK